MLRLTIVDRIYHIIDVKTRKLRAKGKRKKLNNTDFTIISNNCWGGITYEEFGLRKNSPTIGGYFFSDDYLKFVKNLKYYLSLDLTFIPVEKAAHSKWIIENGDNKAIVGVLDDVEIVFIHYPSKEVVYRKWTDRVKRVNWDNLIFKFSKQNHATDDMVREFDEAELPGKKFVFVNKKEGYRCGVYYPGYDNDDEVSNDAYFSNRYWDVIHFINTGEIKLK